MDPINNLEAQNPESECDESPTFNEYSSVKKPRRTYPDEYFDILSIQDPNELEGNYIDIARCHFCDKCIRSSSDGGFSANRFKRHLNICTENTDNWEWDISDDDDDNDNDETPPVPTLDQDSVRRGAVLFTIEANLRFDSFETKSLKTQFFQHLNPEFKPISREEISHDVKQLYINGKRFLIECFKNNPGKIALSYMFRKSCLSWHYISVTAHYIDSDWKLQKRTLGFSVLDFPLSETVGVAIASQVKKWGIGDKVISITLDNFESNDDVTSCLMNSISVKDDDMFFHIRCCSHVLNLIVQDGFQEISSFIKRIEQILLFIYSDQSIFKDFCEECKKLGVEYKRFFLSCFNRWDTTYLMLDGAICCRTVLDRFISGKLNDYSPISDDDWFFATMIRDFLKVLFNAITYLSGKYCSATSCQILCQIFNISLIIEKYPTNPVFSRLCLEMKRKLQNYWEKIPVLFCLCSILDPRLKFRGLEVLLESIYKGGVYDLDNVTYSTRLNEIKSTLEKLFETYQTQSTVNNHDQSNEVGSSSSQAQDKVWEVLMKKFSQSSFSRNSELQCYLDMPNVESYNEGHAFDVLGWWKVQEVNFPVLATMARDLLTVPMSAVSTSYAFRTGEHLLDSYKTVLSPANVNRSGCLRQWYKHDKRIRDASLEGTYTEDDDDVVEYDFDEDELRDSLGVLDLDATSQSLKQWYKYDRIRDASLGGTYLEDDDIAEDDFDEDEPRDT